MLVSRRTVKPFIISSMTGVISRPLPSGAVIICFISWLNSAAPSGLAITSPTLSFREKYPSGAVTSNQFSTAPFSFRR